MATPSTSSSSGFNLNTLFPKLNTLGSLAPTGGAGGNAGPSYAGGVGAGAMFGLDGSNWNVNFGSGDISSDAEKNSAGGLQQYLPWVLMAAAGVLAWRYLKTKQ